MTGGVCVATLQGVITRGGVGCKFHRGEKVGFHQCCWIEEKLRTLNHVT